MSSFPVLRTGAVVQYPFRTTLLTKVDVVWFLDGAEQRMRNAPSMLHRWDITLDQLDEQELRSLEEFVVENQGSSAMFVFTDPTTQQTFPSCFLKDDTVDLTYESVLSGRAVLTILEARS